MFEHDFSPDLEKEEIIGTISNGLFLKVIGRGTNFYTKYNLIATKNFIFGQHIQDGEIRVWQTIGGGPSGPQLQPGAIGALKDYVSKGKVSGSGKSLSSDGSKIDIKWSYNNIQEARVVNSGDSGVPPSLLLRGIQPNIDGTYLILKMGFLNQTLFIFNSDLMKDIASLLSKTQLADKLVSK